MKAHINLIAAGVFICLTSSIAIASETSWPKYAPVNTKTVAPLSQDHGYFKRSPGYDFWKLMPFYVPQFNAYSCSAASVTVVANALSKGGRKDLHDVDRNIMQQELIEKIKKLTWKELVSDKGFEGQHGLTLAQLRDAAEEMLSTYGIQGYQVESITFDGNDIDKLKRLLIHNENGQDDFMMIHFIQDMLTGARGGPYAHISPIGAYDKATNRVLILDVDREYYEPYWADLGNLLKAIVTKTPQWGQGGIVYIKKK